MTKFYVRCGAFNFLTLADDARAAALLAVHHFVDGRVELASLDWTAPSNMSHPSLMETMLELEDDITVSEVGFGRADAGLFDTEDIMTEWNQLVVAVIRLEQDLLKNRESNQGN